MKLLFLNQSRDRAPEKWLKAWVRAISPALEVMAKTRGVGRVAGRILKARAGRGSAMKSLELVVVFVNSGEMKKMNKQFRDKNYATDVLSFESADASSLGELVICPPVIRANAKDSGLSERGELGYMIVHGVLHLLGMDHMNKKDEAEMFALQDALYAALEKKVGLN